MQFGVCAGYEQRDAIISGGFQYLEVNASGLLQARGADLEIWRFLKPPTSNLFFPGDVNPYDQPREALEVGMRVIDKAAGVGVRLMVVGSGRVRNAGDRTPEEALPRFLDLLAKLQEHAKGARVRLAPENLNRTETKVGSDSASLAQACRDRNLGFTLDTYHLLAEWLMDGPDQLAPSPEYVAAAIPLAPDHVHVADVQRLSPRRDDAMLKPVFDRLRELGYRGRCSFEGHKPGSLGWSNAFGELRALAVPKRKTG